jgi:ribosomal protein S18 acetylase RimI-like enzyme
VTTDPGFALRPARAAEAPALTALARTAKASWGYPEAWLEAWAEELTITAAQAGGGGCVVAAQAGGGGCVVAAQAGRILGFSSLNRADGDWRLEHLWVAPAAQRQGVGRALVREARAAVRERGGARLVVVSDPYAEGFYLACGAFRSGVEVSSVLGMERVLPRLAFEPV